MRPATRSAPLALAALVLSCGSGRVTDVLLQCTDWSYKPTGGGQGPCVLARDAAWAMVDPAGAYLVYRSGRGVYVRRIATGEERELELGDDVYVFFGPVDGGRLIAFYSDRAQGLQDYVLVDAESCTWRTLGVTVSTTDPVIGYSKVSAMSLAGERLFYGIYRGVHAPAREILLDLGSSTAREADAPVRVVTEARMDAERVVWLQKSGAASTPGVAVWSSSDGRLLTVDLPAKANPQGLALSGTRAVWTDYRNVYTTPPNTDIYLLDVTTGGVRQLTVNGKTQDQPSILGHLVAWSDNRSGNFDIRVRDLDTGEERVIAATPESERKPMLTAAGLFWQVAAPGGGITVWYDPSVRP